MIGAVHTGQVTAEEKPEKKSASTVLVEIAEELYEFGLSDAGETYGLPRTGPMVVRLLRGGKTSLRGQLSREYFRRTGKAAPQQALADALLVVEGLAQDAEEQPLQLRVARHGSGLWLDLGDATGRAVRITAGGWSVENTPPVLFKRTALNSPLPAPASGELVELWEWLNVAEPDRPLLAAWLVAVLLADIPHPVLGLFGEQGTGKSTAEKVLVSLLDPSPVPLRKPPRDADSWVTAAAGSWVVGLDNLSDIPHWLSDSICRAVTGDGDVRRKLYTDGELAVFAFRRCLIINGIDVGAMRGDLAERLLPINLETISEADRREEHDLWPKWQQAHPRLLGAVLDLAASVTRVLPAVRLDRKPRMADFARILASVDHVLGTTGLARYLAKQGEIATDSLTGDLFITAIAEHLTDADQQSAETFTGTAAELLTLITPADEKWRAPRGWPTTPRQVTQLLKRQAPPMRKTGWTVEHDHGKNKAGVVRWTITPPLPEIARNPDLPSPPGPPTQVNSREQDPPGREPAGIAGREFPALTRQGGEAGQAGDEYEPSQDDQTKPACRQCGQPLLLVQPGRDTCERCRLTQPQAA